MAFDAFELRIKTLSNKGQGLTCARIRINID